MWPSSCPHIERKQRGRSIHGSLDRASLLHCRVRCGHVGGLDRRWGRLIDDSPTDFVVWGSPRDRSRNRSSVRGRYKVCWQFRQRHQPKINWRVRAAPGIAASHDGHLAALSYLDTGRICVRANHRRIGGCSVPDRCDVDLSRTDRDVLLDATRQSQSRSDRHSHRCRRRHPGNLRINIVGGRRCHRRYCLSPSLSKSTHGPNCRLRYCPRCSANPRCWSWTLDVGFD